VDFSQYHKKIPKNLIWITETNKNTTYLYLFKAGAPLGKPAGREAGGYVKSSSKSCCRRLAKMSTKTLRISWLLWT